MAHKISWTEKTWNPVTGCSKVSDGCRHCYAEKMAKRLAGRCGYPADEPFKVTFHADKLDQPGKWRKPKMVFVCSMGDLFHKHVTEEQQDMVYAVMAATPRHTYQVLTKRPENMAEYNDITYDNREEAIGRQVLKLTAGYLPGLVELPLPNVWHGTSAENQECFDARTHWLLSTPSAVRFVSAEPLLGPIDIGMSTATCDCCKRWPSRWVRLYRSAKSDMPGLTGNVVAAANIYRAESNRHGALSVHTPDGGLLGIKPQEFECLPGLNWVIVGAESIGGRPGRECKLEWVRDIRDQCKTAGVPLFIKQLHIDGKLVKDIDRFPDDLRIREYPEVK